MAFQPPAHAAAPQTSRPLEESAIEMRSSVEQSMPMEIAQEWILFPAAAAPAPSLGHATESSGIQALTTSSWPRRSSHSLLELEHPLREPTRDPAPVPAEDGGGREEDDGSDSLDSHLHSFHEPGSHHPDPFAGILPAHDGLGAFPIFGGGGGATQEAATSSSPRARRATLFQRSASLGNITKAQSQEDAEHIRAARIQAWRLEQGRLLLNRMERERRRRSRSRRRADDENGGARPEGFGGEERLPTSVPVRRKATPTAVETRRAQAADDELHGPVVTDGAGAGAGAGASLWTQVSRALERMIGIDDAILSIIMGESLAAPLPATDPKHEHEHGEEEEEEEPHARWEARLLERVASKMGKFMHRTPRHHPTSLPAPPLAWAAARHRSSTAMPPPPPLPPTVRPLHPARGDDRMPRLFLSPHPAPRSSPAASLRAEHASWERDLNVSLVFSFLRNRFRRYRRSAPPAGSAGAADAGTRPPLSAGARAARLAAIRRSHPLLSQSLNKTRPSRPRHATSSSLVSVSASAASAASASLKRAGSSCASESTVSKKQARARPAAVAVAVAVRHGFGAAGSGSGRGRGWHYWDIDDGGGVGGGGGGGGGSGGGGGGGSLDEYSGASTAARMAAPAATTTTGPLGAWGDV
ncbi:MAG: hypothetical protein M1826_002313 [Phylliscum demangeonii]|nr:MAG: hypothetical protein M1826_002313 [Phylliscum demangeonii]